MNVEGIRAANPAGPIEPAGKAAPAAKASPLQQGSDVVEISTAARLASGVEEVPEVRQELVDRIKAEIEAGTYETPERVDAAVEGLMADLFPEV